MDYTLCLSVVPSFYFSVYKKATASLISQVWLCSLMIWFSYVDSSHLPLSGTLNVIAISGQKETELLAFLCLIPGSLCRQLWSGCLKAWGVCLNFTDCQYCPASRADGAKLPHSHVEHRCTDWEVNTLPGVQERMCVCVIDNSKLHLLMSALHAKLNS